VPSAEEQEREQKSEQPQVPLRWSGRSAGHHPNPLPQSHPQRAQAQVQVVQAATTERHPKSQEGPAATV